MPPAGCRVVVASDGLWDELSARAALKLETRWKKYVTYVQILQFSVSFLLLAVSCSGAFGPVRSCSGVRALAGNCAFNAALLYLFFGVLGASTKKRKAA